jgi:hypothetical protein
MSRLPSLGVALALLLAVTPGCASRSDLTAVSSKNVNLSNIRIDREKSKGRTQGEDCQNIILFIPTSGLPTLDEAIDRALEKKRANVLLDAVVNWHSYWAILFGQTCWKVEGDAYDTYE